MIARASLAAGLSWWLGDLVSDDAAPPLLAVFTAMVVIQVSTRASLRMAVGRTVAVVVGAFLGLAVGEHIALSGVTVAVIVAAALLLADFVLRLPLGAARQVPISMVLVLAAAPYAPPGSIWSRAAQTAMGAAIGAAVTLLLPISRVDDRRRALIERARRLHDVYALVGADLGAEWTADRAATWRRRGGTAADEVAAAASDLDVARTSTAWSYRRRRDRAVLDEIEPWARWLDAAAAGLTTLIGDLERMVHRSGARQPAMPAVAAIVSSVAAAIASTVDHTAAPTVDDAADRALQRATVQARQNLGDEAPSHLFDATSLAADVGRLAARLRPPRDAVRSPAASPWPR
jgi:Fusaric acid resistance protein-like